MHVAEAEQKLNCQQEAIVINSMTILRLKI